MSVVIRVGDRIGVGRGTVDWIDSLNLTVASAWKPWRAAHLESSSQRAGYVKTYTPDFTFATVQGAGHLVPTYKP